MWIGQPGLNYSSHDIEGEGDNRIQSFCSDGSFEQPHGCFFRGSCHGTYDMKLNVNHSKALHSCRVNSGHSHEYSHSNGLAYGKHFM